MNDEIKKASFLVYYDNEVIVLRLPDDEAGKLQSLLNGKQGLANLADKDRDKDRDKDSINTISPEPDKSAPDPSGIKLPLNDKTYYDVPLSDIELWKDTYPAVDVEGELKRMIAWLESNPTKKKTRRGITRFINSWLSRTQDRGGSRTGQQAQTPTDIEHNSYYDIMEEYANLPKSPDDPWQ